MASKAYLDIAFLLHLHVNTPQALDEIIAADNAEIVSEQSHKFGSRPCRCTYSRVTWVINSSSWLIRA